MTSLGRQVQDSLPRHSRGARISARVFDVLSQRAPLTVLRGPRGFGKTTAIVRWLSQREDDVLTVYLTLDETAGTEQGFWERLAEACRGSGLDARDDDPAAEPGREHTWSSNVLLNDAEPVRVVLDDYDIAGSASGARAIDLRLLDAVRRNPNLEVIVATRSLRELETVGAVSVDIGVVRPADLALRAGDVCALAVHRGLVVTEEEAERLVTELGGWPAAIRACLDSAATAGTTVTADAVVDDGYLRALLSDQTSSAGRDFLLRTAVPEEFTAAAAQALVPGDQVVGELRKLRASGILRERHTEAGPRYSYPRAIREAILRSVADECPEVVAEVHRALLAHVSPEDGPLGPLRHAVDAAEWDTALQLMEDEWETLLTQHPETLSALARRFPAGYRSAVARLRVARFELPRMYAGELRRNEWVPVPAGMLAEAVCGLVSSPRADEVHVLAQSAIAAGLAGDDSAAIYCFERIHEIGTECDHRDYRVIGAGGSLVALALAGEADQARVRATDPELAAVLDGAGDGAAAEAVRIGGRLAHALASIEALSPESDRAVARILEPRRRDELWSLAACVRGMHAIVLGSAQHRSRAVGALHAVLRHQVPGGIVDAAVRTMLAELYIAEGMLDMAEHVLEPLAPSPTLTATRALLLLTAGRDHEAVETARQCLDLPQLSPRGRLQGEVVMAVGLHRQNQTTAARLRFARGVHVARTSGQRRALRIPERGVLEVLAGNDPDVLSMVQPAPAPGADRGVGGVVSGPLSHREREVLSSLREHRGAVAVAAELGMSVNTAKTHLRNVYRKLGASCRDEALMLGGRLLAERS